MISAVIRYGSNILRRRTAPYAVWTRL